MLLGGSVAALNHLDRYREVARVLVRHGLGFLVVELGNGRWIPRADIRAARASPQITQAAHLRLALEELGPTFIKLGQLLSTRPDVLPPDYVAELSKLQADAPPVPGEIVRQLIETELGDSPDALFADFDLSPLASASIGQAHAAVLKDGTRVVVKVRRPGVVDRVHEDLEILGNLAAQASKRWQWAADYNVVTLADQFSRTLRAELDYLKEGQNAETFARNFRRNSELHIPDVFWDTTTSRVLTLERISGVKVDDSAGLDRAGIDRSAVIATAVDAIAQMVFVDGFFHADPHPGNLFIEEDGRIGLIDFGMVGAIGAEDRDHLATLFVALSKNDAEQIGNALIRMTANGRSIDRAELRRELSRFVTLYEGKELGELEIGPLVTQVLAILRHHRLQLPPDIVMLLRMLSMVEGMGVRLDPQFRLGVALKPYALRLAAERFSPAALATRMGKAGFELAALGVELPEKLRRLVDAVDTNGVELHLRTAELEPLVGRIERIGNRLVAAMVTASLIGGIGHLAAADRSTRRPWSRPLIGAGFGVIGSLGAYLAVSARRHRGR
jgi:ubiquinone biosynthesis protein